MCLDPEKPYSKRGVSPIIILLWFVYLCKHLATFSRCLLDSYVIRVAITSYFEVPRWNVKWQMLVVCINIFNFSYFLLFRSHIKSKHKKFKIRRSTIDVQFRCWILTRWIKQKSQISTMINYIFIVFSAWSNVVLLSTGLRIGIYKGSNMFVLFFLCSFWVNWFEVRHEIPGTKKNSR